MNIPDRSPTIVRVRKGFDESGPELSVPQSELDALHPAHRQDVEGLMAKFALGRVNEDDIAILFRTEGMTLAFPGEVTMTTLLGEVVLTGTPEDVAALQGE